MNAPHHPWRPAEGTKTGRVWEIADELEARFGRLPRVSEVASAYAAEGGHPGTGQVQYYAWKNARRAPPRGAAMAPVDTPLGPDGSGWLAVSPDGHLVLPAALREAMRLDGSGKVRAQVVEGELRLASVPVVIERLQAMASRFRVEGESVVDEFIAEKRAEAERE